MIRIDIWNDFCVPHCFTGETSFLRALREMGIEKEFESRLRAFELDPGFPKGKELSMPQYVEKKYGCSLSEAINKIEIAENLAKEAGIDMNFKSSVFYNTRNAHRVLKYVEEMYGNEKAWQFNFALFNAFFVKNVILDNKSIIETAKYIGLEEEPVKKVLESEAYLKEVLNDESYAYSHGIHSIPMFVFEDKYVIQGSMSLDGFKENIKIIYNKLR